MENRHQPPTDGNRHATSDHMSLTGCMLVALLTTAFIVGGLLGGLGGGGLILWATGLDLAARPSYPVEATATLAPRDTATVTPSPTLLPTTTAASEPAAVEEAAPTITPTPSIADGVSQILPAVVTIVNQKKAARYPGDATDTRVRGSGTIVDPRGYIVTNYHVVQDPGQLTVILGTAQELPARLVAADVFQDLALVKVEAADLAVAHWGSSQGVRPGEWAIAIGSALGDFPNSVTVGVISGVDRSLEMDNHVTVGGLIQTDAAINKGNSGGPLVNQQGEVIGINTFIIREGQQIGVAEGLSFAIPSDRVRDLIDQWIALDSQP